MPDQRTGTCSYEIDLVAGAAEIAGLANTGTSAVTVQTLIESADPYGWTEREALGCLRFREPVLDDLAREELDDDQVRELRAAMIDVLRAHPDSDRSALDLPIDAEQVNRHLALRLWTWLPHGRCEQVADAVSGLHLVTLAASLHGYAEEVTGRTTVVGPVGSARPRHAQRVGVGRRVDR